MELKNKNITILLKACVLGGAERQAIGFAEYAKNNLGCKVTFVATHSNEMSGEFKEFLESASFSKVDYYGKFTLKIKNNFTFKYLKNIIKTFLYLLKMAYQIRKKKPYLIIPFLNPPSKLAVLIYKFTGAKYVFWHQLGLDYFTNDILEGYAIKHTPLFIANAKNGLDLITNSYDVPKNKLFCLPQYVSINRIELNKDKLKAEFKIDNDAVIIGMVSHYRSEKLQEFLIDVFSELIKNYNIHLVLLGDKTNSLDTEKQFNYLNYKINNFGLSKNVSLLSGVPVEKVLNILDIGVLVSTLEGTPNVVLEYMLYGLPVVSTNHAGCNCLINNKELLIHNKKEELFVALKSLIISSKKRVEVGEINENEIKKYSKENYFRKLEDILSIKD